MLSASVGYKCKDCGKSTNHVETTTLKQYIYAVLSGLFTGIASGYIWFMLRNFGFFISLLVAYAVGLCISKTITKVIGYKINPKLKILVGIITVICMGYNPIVIITNLTSMPFVDIIVSFTFFNFTNLLTLLALTIAVWAAVRHMDF